MRIIFIGGINGVGKTSVMDHAIRLYPHAKAIQGSHELMRELGIFNMDYNVLRATPESEKSAALNRVFQRLRATPDDSVGLFAGHFVKILDGEVTPSIGEWYNYCSTLSLITADPASVLERMECDETSGHRIDRRLFSKGDTNTKVDLLAKAQKLSRRVLVEQAIALKLPAFEIDNSYTQVAHAGQQLVEIALALASQPV